MDANTDKEINSINGKPPISLSLYVCYLCLQCFLMIFQLPHIDSMKREKVTQQMNRGAQAIPVMVDPSNVPTPAIALAWGAISIPMILRLAYSTSTLVFLDSPIPPTPRENLASFWRMIDLTLPLWLIIILRRNYQLWLLHLSNLFCLCNWWSRL